MGPTTVESAIILEIFSPTLFAHPVNGSLEVFGMEVATFELGFNFL